MNPGRLVSNILRGLGSVGDELARPLNLALAFVISPLPRRYWRGIGGPGVLLSALVQSGIGLAGLVHVYTSYAQGVSDQLAEATLTVAAESGDSRVNAAPAMAFGALTPLAFFAVSAPAWVVAYCLLSGLVRTLGYATDHPCGDPVLTFVDDVLWEVGRGVGSRARRVLSRLWSLWKS